MQIMYIIINEEYVITFCLFQKPFLVYSLCPLYEYSHIVLPPYSTGLPSLKNLMVG